MSYECVFFVCRLPAAEYGAANGADAAVIAGGQHAVNADPRLRVPADGAPPEPKRPRTPLPPLPSPVEVEAGGAGLPGCS